MNLIPIRDELKEAVELKLMGQVTELNRVRTPTAVTIDELERMLVKREKIVEPLRVGIKELAKLTGRSVRSIRRLVAFKRIPFSNSGKDVVIQKGKRAGMKVKVGGELSFDLVAVRRALDRQQIKAIGD